MSYTLHRSAERDLIDAFRFYKAEAGRGVAGRFLQEFERVVSHGVFDRDPAVVERQKAAKRE